MQHGYDIRGPKTPKEQAAASHQIETWQREARERLPGEIEKSPDQYRVIEVAMTTVKNTLEALGIEGRDISPDQIHLFDEGAFGQLTARPPWEQEGFVMTGKDAMYVRRGMTSEEIDLIEGRLATDKEEKLNGADELAGDLAMEELGLDEFPEKRTKELERYDEVADRIHDELMEEIDRWEEEQHRRFKSLERKRLLHTIIHESLHLKAFRRYYVSPNIEDEKSDITSRSGYDYYHLGSRKFVSLNEAITETLTQDTLERNRDLLATADLEVSEEEFSDSDKWSAAEIAEQAQREGSYKEDRLLLEHIVEGIAQQKEQSVEEVWRRFKASYLTGGMMHLRDIERTFGKGALRFYAGIKPEDLTGQRHRQLVWEYFETDNEEDRVLIEKQIHGPTIDPHMGAWVDDSDDYWRDDSEGDYLKDGEE